jgi:hypothetical protein
MDDLGTPNVTTPHVARLLHKRIAFFCLPYIQITLRLAIRRFRHSRQPLKACL